MTSYILPIVLTLHVAGIIILAGTTLADFVAHRQFWRGFQRDRATGRAMLQTTAGFPALLALGGILVILSGITMVVVLHGVVGEQLWFRIKMGIVLLIILNGIIVARPAGTRLRALVAEWREGGDDIAIAAYRRRLTLFHLSQLTMFLLVVILSIFRFN